jgi:hypothetical protein
MESMSNKSPIGSAAVGSLGLDQKQRKGYETSMDWRVLELGRASGRKQLQEQRKAAAWVARRPGRRHKSLKRKLTALTQQLKAQP